MNQLTGYTSETAENLILDSGVIYKNYNKTTHTGTLVGATQGGAEFSAIPTFRNIQVDGIKGEDIKGLNPIDFWKTSLKFSMLEVTRDTLKMALGATSVTTLDGDYESIKGKNYIADTDYYSNIAFVGKKSGSAKPIVIIIDEAMNKTGLTLVTADSKEGVLPVEMIGHASPTGTNAPPFEILSPIKVVNSATIDIQIFDKNIPSDITMVSSSSSDAVPIDLLVDGVSLILTTDYTITTNTVVLKKEFLSTLPIGEYEIVIQMDKGNNITKIVEVQEI